MVCVGKLTQGLCLVNYHRVCYCKLTQGLRLGEALQYIVGFYVLSDAVKIEKLTGHVNVIRKTAKYLGNILTLRQEKLRT